MRTPTDNRGRAAPDVILEDERRASRYSSTVSLTGCSMSLGSLPVVSSIRAKRPAVALAGILNLMLVGFAR